MKFLKVALVRPDGSNPKDDGEGLESGLDNELRSLLDFLNDRQCFEEPVPDVTRASPPHRA